MNRTQRDAMNSLKNETIMPGCLFQIKTARGFKTVGSSTYYTPRHIQVWLETNHRKSIYVKWLCGREHWKHGDDGRLAEQYHR